MKVSYQGILPDLFREGQGIIATGNLQPDGSVIADEVFQNTMKNICRLS